MLELRDLLFYIHLFRSPLKKPLSLQSINLAVITVTILTFIWSISLSLSQTCLSREQLASFYYYRKSTCLEDKQRSKRIQNMVKNKLLRPLVPPTYSPGKTDLEHVQQSLPTALFHAIFIHKDTAKVQETGMLMYVVHIHHLSREKPGVRFFTPHKVSTQ